MITRGETLGIPMSQHFDHDTSYPWSLLFYFSRSSVNDAM
jgi:hypothetical protein